MTIGQKIYELRNERKLSQTDLADMLDVSRQSVSKWETDMSVPELDKLIKLCNLFDVSLDELAGRNNSVVTMTTSQKNSSENQQKVIGYILLAVSLLGLLRGGFILMLAIPMLICALVCLFIRRFTGYWCIWTMLSVLLCFSNFFFVHAAIYFTTLIFWLAVDVAMIFVIKKTFSKDSIYVTKKNTIKLTVSWILFVLTSAATALNIYMPRSTKSHAAVMISLFPLLITSVVLYVWFVFNYTYTVRYILNLRKNR